MFGGLILFPSVFVCVGGPACLLRSTSSGLPPVFWVLSPCDPAAVKVQVLAALGLLACVWRGMIIRRVVWYDGSMVHDTA